METTWTGEMRKREREREKKREPQVDTQKKEEKKLDVTKLIYIKKKVTKVHLYLIPT